MVELTGARNKSQAVNQVFEAFVREKQTQKLLKLKGQLHLEDNWKVCLRFHFLVASLTTWIEAGRISFALREKGITIPTTDLIIASLALENNCSILTLDPHFQKIPGVEIY